jgi:transposase
MEKSLKPYPTDVSDAEWRFVVPHLTLMRLDAPQRNHDQREVFNALRWLARAGAGWRLLPHDAPPWHAVYEQTHRLIRAEVFDQTVHDLRAPLTLAAGRTPPPTAANFDARTLGSSVESGARAGSNGHTRVRGGRLHLAVDTLGPFLALHVTPANVATFPGVENVALAPS